MEKKFYIVRTFFELFKHDVQCNVLENKVAWILIKLTECLEWRVIIGIDKRKIFDI